VDDLLLTVTIKMVLSFISGFLFGVAFAWDWAYCAGWNRHLEEVQREEDVRSS